MAVTKDALGTEASISMTANGTQNYTGLTVVSNTNGAIVITIATSVSGDTIASITGYARFATITASDNTNHVELWGKVGNSTGAQTIAITAAGTWSFTDGAIVSAISVTGADQTGGTTTFAHAVTATGTNAAPASGNVTTSTSNLAVAIAADTLFSFSTPNQTQIYLDNVPNPTSAAQYEQNGASPTTFTWALDGSTGPWSLAALDIVAAAGADTLGGAMPTLMMSRRKDQKKIWVPGRRIIKPSRKFLRAA